MWIKICGITRPEDAIAAASVGASAIGLNFFSGSKRFVSQENAIRIADTVRSFTGSSPTLVGVFVNSSPDEILSIAETVGLNAVQFHGDESLADMAQVHAAAPQLLLIRAMRISESHRERCLKHLRDLQNHVRLFAILLDAFVAGEFGGTGTTIDRRLLRDDAVQALENVVIAGGLTPANVAEMIEFCRPWGVDTASGVESAPGIKNHAMITDFVRNARAAAASR